MTDFAGSHQCIVKHYRRVFHGVLLAILIGLCYSNTLQQEWHFDDFPRIAHNENLHIHDLTLEELKRALEPKYEIWFLSRPVANLTFALNYFYSGLDTTSYHVVNIAIHILCGIFAYLVFVRTLGLLGVRENESGGIGRSDIALLGAVLWALHPIQTQAVTYIVQRMASLAGLFYLAAMYCYLWFRISESLPRKILLLLLALVFWLAGVFSKENAVLLPLAILAFEMVFNNEQVRQSRRILFICLGMVVIGLFVISLHLGKFSHYFLEPYEKRPFTMTERLITQPLVLTRYLFLLGIPLADFLNLESNIFASSGLFAPPSTLFALVFILALLAAATFSLKKHPLLRFAILFFFINHLVESTFIGLELYFEHRNYLPSVFLYLASAYYFCRLLAWYRLHGRRLMTGLLTLLVTVVLISEGNATYLRNEVWETQVSLLKDSIEKAPKNIRPYVSLAAELMKLNRVDEALQYLRKAEAIYKENPERHHRTWMSLLYYNAGVAYLKKSDQDKAARLFYKSSEFNGENLKCQEHLAYQFFRTGDLKNAEIAISNAMAIAEPTIDPLHLNFLGRLYFEQGKYLEAERAFQKSLKYGWTPEPALNLTAVLMEKGEIEKAREEFRRIPVLPENAVFLLYGAYLFPGVERATSLRTLAELLVANNIDTCEWLNEIRQNRSATIIYPDISEFEEEIFYAYSEVLEEAAVLVKKQISRAQTCSAGQVK